MAIAEDGTRLSVKMEGQFRIDTPREQYTYTVPHNGHPTISPYKYSFSVNGAEAKSFLLIDHLFDEMQKHRDSRYWLPANVDERTRRLTYERFAKEDSSRKTKSANSKRGKGGGANANRGDD